MWTDLQLGADRKVNEGCVANKINDYRYIRVASKGYRKLTSSDVIAAHRNHLHWLDQALNDPFDGRTFVATHHATHPSVLEDQFGQLAAAYASDLSDLIHKYRPERWFFGHCHGGKNVRVGDTNLINVSLGYPEEVPDPASRVKELLFEL